MLGRGREISELCYIVVRYEVAINILSETISLLFISLKQETKRETCTIPSHSASIREKAIRDYNKKFNWMPIPDWISFQYAFLSVSLDVSIRSRQIKETFSFLLPFRLVNENTMSHEQKSQARTDKTLEDTSSLSNHWCNVSLFLSRIVVASQLGSHKKEYKCARVGYSTNHKISEYILTACVLYVSLSWNFCICIHVSMVVRVFARPHNSYVGLYNARRNLRKGKWWSYNLPFEYIICIYIFCLSW